MAAKHCVRSSLLAVAIAVVGCSDGGRSNAVEPIGHTKSALVGENGIWQNGLTTNGIWQNGIWQNGIWQNGIWQNGIWQNGIWQNGIWQNGIWQNGIWQNGIWQNGIWQNGIWQNGIWQNGIWQNGIWQNGIWQNGLAGESLRGSQYARQLLQYVYACAMPVDVVGSGDGGTGDGGTGDGGEVLSSYAITLDPIAGLHCASDADCHAADHSADYAASYSCSNQTQTCVIPCTVDAECPTAYSCSEQNPLGADAGTPGKTCKVRLTGVAGLGINADESTWWGSGKCDESCQRWVSACVLARTNAYGETVRISMRAPDDAPAAIRAALATTPAELDEFPLREGAFYGNIFATTGTPVPPPSPNFTGCVGTPTPPGFTSCAPGPISSPQTIETPSFFACAGPGSNIPDLTRRFCSSQGDDSVITVPKPGVCRPTPYQATGVCAKIDGENPDAGVPGDLDHGALHNCKGGTTTYSQVITVYIHDYKAEACGNSVCEAREESSGSCPSDCHPGTWGRTWDAVLGGAAMDRTDGSIVIAGTASGPIDLGTGPLSNEAGTDDLVMAKYRANGTPIWARRQANSLGTVTAAAIADDGTIVLGGLNPTTLGGWVAKFDKGTDANGNVTPTYGDLLTNWPVTFAPLNTPSGGVDSLSRLAVDHNGRVIGAGSFHQQIIIGSATLSQSAGAFLVSIPAGGAPVMNAAGRARDFGGSSSSVNGIGLDPSNDILVTLAEGSNSVVHKLASANLNDVANWPKSYASVQISSGGVASDSTGAVYVTGSAFPFDFGGGISHNENKGEFFLVKYSADGVYRWDVAEGGHSLTDAGVVNPNATRAYSTGVRLAFDSSNNVVVSGQFGPGSIDMGTGLFDAYKSDDFFVASYLSDDTLEGGVRRLLWVKHVPMVLTGVLSGADISGTTANRFFAAGKYSGSMLLDDRIMISTMPEEPSHLQTFLSSFNSPLNDTIKPDVGHSKDQAGASIFTVPQDIFAEATSAAGAKVFYMPPTATDDGYSGVSVSCLPPPNTMFPISIFPQPGPTIVRCTATDPAGNQSAEVTFKVTVADTLGPAITVNDMKVAATDANGATVTYSPTAIDQVDGQSHPVTCDPPSPHLFPVGKTTVTCTSQDNKGNPSQASFVVNVTGPGAPCPSTGQCASGTCVDGVCCSTTSCGQCQACNVPGSMGTCAPTSGGTCSDSNACTQSDTCQNGTCTGGNPVGCSASDQCHVAGVCDPSTGACSNPAAANGTGCSDGNACTQSDTCQNGTCTGGNPVGCSASDQCHVAGTCDPSTGACSNPAAANGTGCSDGNACTQSDTCQNGTCTGGNPVGCSASDQCHVAGTCDPSTGACSNPAAANGTGCSDGNACTQSDTCQAGTCMGSNPVMCSASDQCHVAGACNPSTGACSNPAAANGTGCSDGNACTQSDTCQAGTCMGSNPVICSASDQCHVAGACDPSTGACSNPAAANGTGCSDGNACTQTDSCQNGTCTGGNPVACSASDQCHVAGVCDPSTGTCSNPAAANGTGCSDGNGCTQTDSCQNGTCTGGNPVACSASDQCHVAGACDPSTGTCSNPAAANGTGCSDGNGCTQTDSCQNGTCTGGNPVACSASDQCHVAGACDPSTGTCSNPAAANGTGCNDGNACTQSDACQGGVCTGSNPVTCTASAQCYVAGQCTYSWSGVLQPINADGTSIFKLGSTVPVQFMLTGASAGITDAVATLSVAKVSSSVTGSYSEAVSTSAATTGNAFRYEDGRYIFNLSTGSLSKGTWLLSIDLHDGVTRTILISLR